MGLKLAGAVLSLLMLVGLVYLIGSKVFSAGETSIKAGVASARSKNLEASQKGILEAVAATQAAEDKISAAPASDDGPIAPVLRRELDRP